MTLTISYLSRGKTPRPRPQLQPQQNRCPQMVVHPHQKIFNNFLLSLIFHEIINAFIHDISCKFHVIH